MTIQNQGIPQRKRVEQEFISEDVTMSAIVATVVQKYPELAQVELGELLKRIRLSTAGDEICINVEFAV